MQFSRATEYALLGLTYLAQKEAAASTREIAESERLSPYFLRNVFRKLREAQLVKPYRGKGYILNQKPQAISLQTVVEAVEGKVNIHECLEKKRPDCLRSRNCRIVMTLGVLQKKFITELNRIHLNDLL